MTNLTNGYTVDIDCTDKTTWSELLHEFDDASIHQSWSMGANSFGEGNLSHLVLRRDGEVIGMAQVSIRKPPVIGPGVARVFWGPLWRKKRMPADYAVLERMIETLKNEYAAKRGLLLRIWPIGFENSEAETISILGKHGFIRNPRMQPYRTLLLDLSPPLEELRKNLASNWRNHLKIAEKSDLSLIHGTSDEMFSTFLRMLRETVFRKKFITRLDYDLYRQIQSDLPEPLKMKIFLCANKGEPVAAGVFSAIGETCEYLFGATANGGLKFNGSNLIQWGVIKWLKEIGCRWYDLGGIDPSGNPGVYHFKRGLVGKSGRDVAHLGQYFVASKSISYLLNTCIDLTSTVRARLRNLKLFH